jgi:WG containing repeat
MPRMKSLWLKAFVLVVFCLTLFGCQNSQQSTPSSTSGSPAADSTPTLLPVKVSGKWGYINGTGQLVINPQFDFAEEFHEGRAGVCLGKPCDYFDSTSPNDSHWGFIDTSGKVIVTPQYPEASVFREGLASVCTGDCSMNPTQPFSRGYIDRDGKLVIPMQFGIASSFSEGLAQVCIGKCQWDKDTGYSGKFGFIDHSGHFVINPQYDNVFDFKNGYAKVFIGKGTDAKGGYIDKTGKTIWQPSN